MCSQKQKPTNLQEPINCQHKNKKQRKKRNNNTTTTSTTTTTTTTTTTKLDQQEVASSTITNEQHGDNNHRFVGYISIPGKRFIYEGVAQNSSTHRTFFCESCNKTLPEAGNLGHNLKVHGEEWPHSCTGCSKRFKQPSALQLHINKYCESKFPNAHTSNGTTNNGFSLFETQPTDEIIDPISGAGIAMTDDSKDMNNKPVFFSEATEMKTEDVDYTVIMPMILTKPAEESAEDYSVSEKTVSEAVEINIQEPDINYSVSQNPVVISEAREIKTRSIMTPTTFRCHTCKKTLPCEGNELHHRNVHMEEWEYAYDPVVRPVYEPVGKRIKR